MSSTARVLLGEEELDLPLELLQDREVFSEVLSLQTWQDVLREEDREELSKLLPDHCSAEEEEVLRQMFSGENLKFGSPMDTFWKKLNRGELSPEVHSTLQQLRQLKYQHYQYEQKRYFVHLLQEMLITRQEVMQSALAAGPLENLTKKATNGQKRKLGLERRVEAKYRRILSECRRELGLEGDVSSDEETQPNGIAAEGKDEPISEEEYHRMLRKHHRRRLLKRTDPDLVTSGLNLAKVTQRQKDKKSAKCEEPIVTTDTKKQEEALKPLPSWFAEVKSDREGGGDEGSSVGVRGGGGRRKKPSMETQAVYEVYAPIDTGTAKDSPPQPIVIWGPLPKGKFMSFFSLLKHIFEPLHDQKGELNKITKSVRTLLRSSDCAMCSWTRLRRDWTDLVLPALCYLAAEVGAVSSFDPLSHFIPILEFRDRIDHWKWIGHGRDSDLELLVLYNHWMDTLDKSLVVVDYSDYEPPAPHVWTHFMFRQSTPEEVVRFREQERERYTNPQKAFTYNVHGFESPVGPVKGARAVKKDSGGSRARGHALLVSNRPNCVTILSLVRDATSRMPNGEGTRIDLCVLVRDSQYLADTVSDSQMNNAVSGALDRLHYEKDPCVRYDNARKVWIYLHRGRTEEDFERIHWACEVASKQRKLLMSRPRSKPFWQEGKPFACEMVPLVSHLLDAKKIVVKNERREVTIEPGHMPKLGVSKEPGAVPATMTSGSRRKAGQPGCVTGMQTKVASKSASHAVAPGTSLVVASVMRTDCPAVSIEQSLNPASMVQQTSFVGTPAKRSKSGKQAGSQKEHGDSRRKKRSSKVSRQPLTAATFQESDWESSDEEMPFLDSSLLPGDKESSRNSTSSWQSSESEDNDANIGSAAITTPNFLANISMEEGLGGEQFEASGSDGEGFNFDRGPPAWLSDSSSNSD